MTEKENEEICQAQVTNFFEGVKPKKHPPPEEKIDPMKAKRTFNALKKPPKSPLKGNYALVEKRSNVKHISAGLYLSRHKCIH